MGQQPRRNGALALKSGIVPHPTGLWSIFNPQLCVNSQDEDCARTGGGRFLNVQGSEEKSPKSVGLNLPWESQDTFHELGVIHPWEAQTGTGNLCCKGSSSEQAGFKSPICSLGVHNVLLKPWGGFGLPGNCCTKDSERFPCSSLTTFLTAYWSLISYSSGSSFISPADPAGRARPDLSTSLLARGHSWRPRDIENVFTATRRDEPRP